MTESSTAAVDVDVVVVGAGFGGLYALKRLRDEGWTVRGFEAGDGVGGTWYWNRYPGARCDVPSLEYSYSFDPELEQEWEWTERYAAQPEILRYVNHVADRYDLRAAITFNTRVETATFDETSATWLVTTSGTGNATTGEAVRCRFLVMATGCLSEANAPSFPGLDSFGGDVLHTGRWPHEPVDLAGKRVAVIGTGSSGIQAIPVIAEAADHLTVFQRTPNYSVPAGNEPLTAEDQAELKANYAELRAKNRRMQSAYAGGEYRTRRPILSFEPDERDELMWTAWKRGGPMLQFLFNDVGIDTEANAVMAGFIKDRIAEAVQDPELAAKLQPDYYFACKRVCLDTDYFQTYNRDNVALVDLRATPITEITAQGIRTSDGTEHAVDTIVMATGFDAVTGALNKIVITGRDGRTLKEEWAAGPRAYLGLGVPGFPNLFTLNGPGSPSVLANMITTNEQHVDFVTDCLGYLRDNGVTTIEATEAAADQWLGHVNDVAGVTLLSRCDNWYVGANIPGKPRQFMPLLGFPGYVVKCNEVAANDYEGFALR